MTRTELKEMVESIKNEDTTSADAKTVAAAILALTLVLMEVRDALDGRETIPTEKETT